nr:TetR/AcrR family transcriptional regulator [uncultured Desulfuromonas sp.]
MGKIQIASEEKRKRILLEARRLFAEKGFHAVSIPEIVRASGVSTGTVYNNFSSKEDLAREIYRTSRIELERRVELRVNKEATAYKKLCAVIDSFLELAEINYDLIAFLFLSESSEFFKKPASVFDLPTGKIILRIFSEGIEQLDIKPGNLPNKVCAFYGILLMAIKTNFTNQSNDPLPPTRYKDIRRRVWSASFI